MLEVDEEGNQIWSQDNKLHRVDGPAWIGVGGHTEWWLHGKLHRDDGPAVEIPNLKAWYTNGKFVKSEKV